MIGLTKSIIHYVFSESIISFIANSSHMKRLFTLLSLATLFYSCNNGDYDADPNTDLTTSPGLTCPLVATDTVCSCTDSLSLYSQGTLYSFDTVRAIHDPDNYSNIVITTAYGRLNGLEIATPNYTGPGTYTLSANDASMSFAYNDSDDYVADAFVNKCTYVKMVITEDNGSIIKGTFYGVVENTVPEGDLGARSDYRAIKGGQFIARWMN